LPSFPSAFYCCCYSFNRVSVEGVGAVEFYRRIARACDDIRAQLAQAIRKLDREILKQTFRGALCALPWRILRPPRRSLATTALTLRNDVQCEIVILSPRQWKRYRLFAD